MIILRVRGVPVNNRTANGCSQSPVPPREGRQRVSPGLR